MKRLIVFFGFFVLGVSICAANRSSVHIEQAQFELPVLMHKDYNPVLRLKFTVPEGPSVLLEGLTIDLGGTTSLRDVKSMAVLYTGLDSMMSPVLGADAIRFGAVDAIDGKVSVLGEKELATGVHFFWVSYTLSAEADLLGRIGSVCTQVLFSDFKTVPVWSGQPVRQRVGVAVRQHMQDGVHTSRIPGLATTNNGVLLAVFDARYESARDLQGHMDIGLHRSTDGGQTWEPLQIAMDMGEWGGLPQKFNGVSDACILVDRNSDAIYIAGLWMHGVIDDNGKWMEGLTENSEEWNHQWRDKGSQPGFGVKQTSQFLIVKSTDDGKTWGEPINLTEMGKQEEWWLWAPAPGRGITMEDGTLVFPTEGRDAAGKQFSNITYSKDGGKTWQASQPAQDVPEGTTECAVAQLSDGSLMLNMRSDRNWSNLGPENGRVIAVTSDLGRTWEEHPTSRGALPESSCMASLFTHAYSAGGVQQRLLLFMNPNSKTARDHLTLKMSNNDGESWPEEQWLLLDEWDGSGYSCITNVDEDHIGVLYESSQANMVFQKIPLSEIITK